MKTILALVALVCLFPCLDASEGKNLRDLGYHVNSCSYDGHYWIIIRRNFSEEFQLIHHPDCLCMPSYGCVEVQHGGKYVVDQYGSVENV